MPIYENTILNALKQYDIHIRIMNGLNDMKINSSRLNQIRNCMEYVKSDSEYLGQEHKELHFCDQFFTEFYEKLGVDNKYMDIDF